MQGGRADYLAWRALFVVLAEEAAAPYISVVAPALDTGPEVRRVAVGFVREEPNINSNAEGDAAIAAAVDSLNQVVGSDQIEMYRNVANLLQRETSGVAGQAGLWWEILRHWPREAQPAREEPGASVISVLNDQMARTHDVLRMRHPLSDPEPEWQSLLEEVLERRALELLKARIEGMGPRERSLFLDQARNIASQRGIPQELVSLDFRAETWPS